LKKSKNTTDERNFLPVYLQILFYVISFFNYYTRYRLGYDDWRVDPNSRLFSYVDRKYLYEFSDIIRITARSRERLEANLKEEKNLKKNG